MEPSPSLEMFQRQCKRWFGRANPERMRVEHWEWMVRYGGGPYGVRSELGLDSNEHPCNAEGCCGPADPDWCFERFGMTRTPLPDGRIICVAGEHEDSYDPDFCIYNDVIVLRPIDGEEHVTFKTGEVEIYGYPEDVFPPTDFHTATLVGERLILIGSLGYPHGRRSGRTQIFGLSLADYRIEPVHAAGEGPGWIFKHEAVFEPGAGTIMVRGGSKQVERDGEPHSVKNNDEFRLHLAEGRWERLTDHRSWRQFKLFWDYRSGIRLDYLGGDVLGVAGVERTEEVDLGQHLLWVNGVAVRCEQGVCDIDAVVEGTLPGPTVVGLIARLCAAITEALGTKCDAIELPT